MKNKMIIFIDDDTQNVTGWFEKCQDAFENYDVKHFRSLSEFETFYKLCKVPIALIILDIMFTAQFRSDLSNKDSVGYNAGINFYKNVLLRISKKTLVIILTNRTKDSFRIGDGKDFPPEILILEKTSYGPSKVVEKIKKYLED